MPGRLLALALELGRAQEGLRGDAAPVRALAAEHVVLDERNALAGLQERVDRNLSARAAADDHHVESISHLSHLLQVDAVETRRAERRYSDASNTLAPDGR